MHCYTLPESRRSPPCVLLGDFPSGSDAVQMNPANAPKKKRSSQHSSAALELEEAENDPSGAPTSPVGNGTSTISSSNFRNVSACNRCRLRKNRCDQKLPACTSCEKANVKCVCLAIFVIKYDTKHCSRCVGFDPVSKREIPRR